MSPFHSALVVNCCQNDDVLTQREFIWPIQRALGVPSKVVLLKKLNEKMTKEFDVIVFSGCQLKDNAYLKQASKLTWLTRLVKPILGVCAGQHLIALAFGGKVKPMKQPSIGVHPIHIIKKSTFLDSYISPINVYALHSHIVSLPNNFTFIAKSTNNPTEIIVHESKPIVGFAFHPEVLNKRFFAAFLEWAGK